MQLRFANKWVWFKQEPSKILLEILQQVNEKEIPSFCTEFTTQEDMHLHLIATI